MQHTQRAGLVLIAVSLVVFSAEGAGWPQFHGPARDNRVPQADLPLRWSETQGILWKTAISGRAWSSPVVLGGQVWLTNATEDGRRMSALCLDLATGSVVHDILLLENENPAGINGANSYASPTPALEPGRVFAHFGSYGTFCLDPRDGKTLWERRDLVCDHEVGPGSSVLLLDDRLVLTYDGIDARFLVALDKQTGRTLWRTDRTIDFGSLSRTMRKAFSTPAVAGSAAEPLLISPGAGAVMAFEAATGKERWRVCYAKGFSTSSRARVHGDLVFVNSGYSRPRLLAVRLGGSGDVTDTHVAWEIRRDVPVRASPVIVDGLLYMVSDNGVVTCLDPAGGDVVWRERIGGRYSASPLAVGKRIYLVDEKGISTVIQAGRKYLKLAEGQLDAGCMASPAVVDDTLVLRTRTHVYRIGALTRLPPSAQRPARTGTAHGRSPAMLP